MGVPTRMGSLATDENGPWTVDAPVAQRLREAGTVLLGKTTTPEYGWKGVTDSPLFGVFAERDLAGRWVHVRAGDPPGGLLIEPALTVDLAAEVPSMPLAVRGLIPRSPLPVRALRDASH